MARTFKVSLRALRFYNIFLGLISLLLLYLSLETVFPNKPLIALGARKGGGK